MNIFNDFTKMVNLKEYKISLSPGINASRPKYQITTPSGEVYFKFKMTNNEIGQKYFLIILQKL